MFAGYYGRTRVSFIPSPDLLYWNEISCFVFPTDFGGGVLVCRVKTFSHEWEWEGGEAAARNVMTGRFSCAPVDSATLSTHPASQDRLRQYP